MTTSLSIPPAASGDNILNTTNANNDLIESAYGSIDGANIQSGTVPPTALMADECPFAVSYGMSGSFAGFSGVKFEFKVPNINGGSSSNWKFFAVSTCGQTLTTATGTMDVRKNGTTMLAAAIDFSTLVGGTATLTYPVTEVSLTSGDAVDLIFAGMGGPAADLSVVIYFKMILS